MQRTITLFDTEKHHIYIPIFVTHPLKKTRHRFRGLIDTGAPATEFVDTVLVQAGFIQSPKEEVKIKGDLQSQKYGKITFPKIEICGQVMTNFEAYVTRLDESWGVDVLIGLDFFKRFRVTIDYKAGHLITEPL